MTETPVTLTGRIAYRLELSSSSLLVQRKRKRRREQQQLFETQAPFPFDVHSEKNDKEPIAGYVFEEERNHQVTTTSYLISVPLNLLKDVCDACRFRYTVRLYQYTLLPLKTERGDGIRALLEVGGMQILRNVNASSFEGAPFTKLIDDNDDVWTLPQLARRETMDRHDGISTTKHELYCFRGTVAAVSPIIAMDPNDPFSLLEITNNNERDTSYSCVIVLRKDGLQCVPAIVPGDSLILTQIAKLKWRIPQVLMADNTTTVLAGKVPKSVFVVDRANQIQWEQFTIHNNVPSSLLANIEGYIEAVHMMMGANGDNTSRHIHYVELFAVSSDADNAISPPILLFLTYFPMSSSLQLSLRKGAIIQASNVHRLPEIRAFCACLRSHVAITSLATANTADREPLSLKNAAATPYTWLRRVRRSYPELLYRRSISKMLDDFYVPSFQNGTCCLPSFDDLSRTLLGLSSSGKTKGPVRNAYAEFFDHNEPTEPNTPLQKQSGCHVSCYERNQCSSLLLIGLNQIQDYGFVSIKQRLRVCTQQEHPLKIGVGWTGSIGLSGQGLGHTINGSGDNDCSIYTVGFGDVNNVDGISFGTVSNGHVELPLVLNSDCEYAINGGFFWAKIQSITVSCICIGVPKSVGADVTNTHPVSITVLPPLQSQKLKGKANSGPCAVVQTNGYCFVISVYIVCDQLLPLEGPSTTEHCAIENHSKVCSVQDCLISQNPEEMKATACLGLLARTIYKPYRVKKGEYSGFVMTVAHAPKLDQVSFCDQGVSCLQSIEVKPPVTLDSSMRNLLRASIATLLRQGIHNDQLNLGLAWWKLASCAKTCALLRGGWDEGFDGIGDAAVTKMGVVVRLPLSNVFRDPRRGYIRFRCKTEDIVACVRSFPQTSHSGPDRHNQQSMMWDFIGGRKFITGNLDRRPRRRVHGGIVEGELLCISSADAGVPSHSLASLFTSLCQDLRTRSRIHLAPSLVREIRGATFLGVYYCRALAECSKCYAALCDSSPAAAAKSKNKGIGHNNGVKTSVSVYDLDLDRRPTFWHVPLPDCPNPVPAAQPAVPLRCPNNCRTGEYAIKWECSGTLDDGTGQAKLYAEREAALCLLGLPTSTIKCIEEGAWLNENGIVFSKTMPPKAQIREAVLTARALALNDLRLERHRRFLEDKDVLLYLTPVTRAEYLLQHHCRSSKEPVRELTYFVRAKPLSDDVIHLNQTEIEVATRRDVATYSLPPLKLNLIDCAAPPKPGYDDLMACTTAKGKSIANKDELE